MLLSTLVDKHICFCRTQSFPSRVSLLLSPVCFFVACLHTIGPEWLHRLDLLSQGMGLHLAGRMYKGMSLLVTTQ